MAAMARVAVDDGSESEPIQGVVFAPALFLTVTVEGGTGGDEVYVHAGGQGYWVAQLMYELGTDVTLVAPVGGEAGSVLGAIVEARGIRLRSVPIEGTNAASVNDRRSGDQIALAEMPPTALAQHSVNELYSAVLDEALEADVCVLAGRGSDPLLDPAVYERLAADLRAYDKLVVSDVSGEPLKRALDGGVSVLKTSADDLHEDGMLASHDFDEVLMCARRLADWGADMVVVTRGAQGAIVVCEGEMWRVEGAPLAALESADAEAALTAALAASLAEGQRLVDALRIAGAAAALNISRRGLGSGSRQEIERLAEHVVVEPILG